MLIGQQNRGFSTLSYLFFSNFIYFVNPGAITALFGSDAIFYSWHR